MPGLDGLELAMAVRQAGVNKTTPVVMITGASEHTATRRAFEVGVNFFLFKPVDRSRLMRLLNAADSFIRREKLRFLRVKLKRGASIDCGERRVKGTTLDVSLGGMSVQASAPLPVGSAVHVGLEAKPGLPPLRLPARVVRVFGQDCMGLQLEKAGTPETQAFQDLVEPLLLQEM